MKPIKPQHDKSALLAAFRDCGSVSATCKKLGISRATFYRYVNARAIMRERLAQRKGSA